MDQQQHQQQYTSSASQQQDQRDAVVLNELFEEYAVISCDPNRKRTRRRIQPSSVSFAEQAFLYGSTRTTLDLPDCWYNRHELAVFKKERKAVVKVLKKVNFDTRSVCQRNVCLRGYEPYFSVEMNKQTKYARELVNQAVMGEQARQVAAGCYDQEAVRVACESASEWARENALELGVLDALESFALTLPMESWQALDRFETNKEIVQMDTTSTTSTEDSLRKEYSQQRATTPGAVSCQQVKLDSFSSSTGTTPFNTKSGFSTPPRATTPGAVHVGPNDQASMVASLNNKLNNPAAAGGALEPVVSMPHLSLARSV